MTCPICHENTATLTAINRRFDETCLMLQCNCCPTTYPCDSQSTCPNLDAFAEMVDEDFRDFLGAPLEVSEKCVSGDHESCPHFYAKTCPFETSICQALLGGAVLFPRTPARVLLPSFARVTVERRCMPERTPTPSPVNFISDIVPRAMTKTAKS